MDWSRQVRVGSARLAGWLARFGDAHGSPAVEPGPEAMIISAPDGARARIEIPFAPLVDPGSEPLAALLRHVQTDRTVGVLLVRRRGHAVGVFRGSELLASAAGSAYVQGATKAGGWSQQRYARRRANQARSAYERAADHAVEVLVPYRAQLAAVVAGGDRAGVREVLSDPRLSGVSELVAEPFLAVPDPRQKVLVAAIDQVLSVRIDLNELA